MPWHNVFQYSYRRMKATWCHHIKKVSSWKVPLVPMNQQYISNDIIFRDRIIIPICEHLGNLKKTHLNMLYWPIGLLAYWLPIGNQTSVLGAIAPLWCLNADVQTSAHKNILPMFEHADYWTWSNIGMLKNRLPIFERALPTNWYDYTLPIIYCPHQPFKRCKSL